MSDITTSPPRDAADDAEEAIRQWAEADYEIGWGGSAEVREHAHELAGYLFDAGLLK